MLMDVFKSLGHDIHIVSRSKKEELAKVDMQLMDDKAKPRFLPVEVKTTMDLSHHSVKELRKFQPLRYVSPNDISMHRIPVVYWGNRFLTPWAPKVVEMMEEADYVFCDTEMYVRMESDLDIADKHIQFVHFPTENLMPVTGKEPRIWVNSKFTKSWVRIRWGYNNPNYTKLEGKYATLQIPMQIFDATVVNPPLYIEDYKNDLGFKDRNYDVVMFARLGEDKFTVADFLNEHFNLLSMGALSPVKPIPPLPPQEKGVKRIDLNVRQSIRNKPRFKPTGTLRENLTFKDIIKLLSTAKVYVHGKGFGMMKSGGASLPEHFGITICEAMASGCPVIVPRTGGCWTDISQLGKYTLSYSSLEELKFHVDMLIRNKKEWEKWHNLALEGVRRFDTENVRNQVAKLLN